MTSVKLHGLNASSDIHPAFFNEEGQHIRRTEQILIE